MIDWFPLLAPGARKICKNYGRKYSDGEFRVLLRAFLDDGPLTDSRYAELEEAIRTKMPESSLVAWRKELWDYLDSMYDLLEEILAEVKK